MLKEDAKLNNVIREAEIHFPQSSPSNLESKSAWAISKQNYLLLFCISFLETTLSSLSHDG